MKDPRILFSILFTLLCLSQGFAQKYPDVLAPHENTPNRRPVTQSPIREADIMWSKRIWRVIDLREKMNLPLYYPDVPSNSLKSMFDVIKDGIRTGKITCFGNPLMDDQFQLELTVTEFEKLVMSWDTLLDRKSVV